MKKINLMVMTGVLTVAMTGCSPVEDAKSIVEASTASSESLNEEPNDAASVEQSVDAAGSEALDALIEGKNTVSFKYYAENMLDKEDNYASEAISNLSADKEYTLSELKDELNKIYDNGIELMEYAYLDCGADGVKEMALRVQGPIAEPGSKATFIIKEIDSKLQVVYAYAEWGRNETNINEYGYITGGGSGGASVHYSDAACINADGKYEFGYSEEEQLDIDQFADFKEHEEFGEKDYEGVICVYTLRLEPYSEGKTPEERYAYTVCDDNTYEPVDVPNLYTDSPYKNVMDSFKDIKFMTMDELKQAEEEKLKSIGVTEQIKNGNIPEYKEINI